MPLFTCELMSHQFKGLGVLNGALALRLRLLHCGLRAQRFLCTLQTGSPERQRAADFSDAISACGISGTAP
jgi:hypothetical protein